MPSLDNQTNKQLIYFFKILSVMTHVRVYNIGDTLTCIDGVDSHGLLKKGKKYVVADTDHIRVQLENIPLTWSVTRFKLAKKTK